MLFTFKFYSLESFHVCVCEAFISPPKGFSNRQQQKNYFSVQHFIKKSQSMEPEHSNLKLVTGKAINITSNVPTLHLRVKSTKYRVVSLMIYFLLFRY